MLDPVILAMTLADDWLAAYMPLIARICLLGAIAGSVAMGIYSVVSPQAAISVLKSRARELRQRMSSPELELSQFTGLARQNIVIALTILAKVAGPTLLSMAPVLVVILWLDTFHAYALPPAEEGVRISVSPSNADVLIEPKKSIRRLQGGHVLLLGSTSPKRILAEVGGIRAYAGDPMRPPVPVIGKRRWWNILLPNKAGYLEDDAPIEEIRFAFPRKRVMAGLPVWASGWELPFFVSVAVAAVSIKIAWRIQ